MFFESGLSELPFHFMDDLSEMEISHLGAAMQMTQHCGR
jgi:hypothetical protein